MPFAEIWFFPGKYFRNPEGIREAELRFGFERLGRDWLSLGRDHVDAGLGSASLSITTAFFSPSVIPCSLPPWGSSLCAGQAGESKYGKIFGQLPEGKPLSHSCPSCWGLLSLAVAGLRLCPSLTHSKPGAGQAGGSGHFCWS